MDDFGTGYSSLGFLKRIPLDVLKVDKSFVSGLSREPRDRTLVCAIIDMAHALGLEVVAEGVEDKGQLAFLTGRGCDRIQGYHYSRPLAAQAFATFRNAFNQTPASQDGQVVPLAARRHRQLPG